MRVTSERGEATSLVRRDALSLARVESKLLSEATGFYLADSTISCVAYGVGHGGGRASWEPRARCDRRNAGAQILGHDGRVDLQG